MSSTALDPLPRNHSIHLPTELLSQIFLDPFLSSLDLVNLCRTSRQLLHPARQVLYRRLTVSLWYDKHASIPPYRMTASGRMYCDKRTLSLIRTLRKSPDLANLARFITIKPPDRPYFDLQDFQTEDYGDGMLLLVKLLPNLVSLQNLSNHSVCHINDRFLGVTPRIVELDLRTEWPHEFIKQESTLDHLRKLRCDYLHFSAAPSYSIANAPSFLNLRVLDFRDWQDDDTEFPARLVPNLQVLRTPFDSLKSIDISSFPHLQTLHLHSLSFDVPIGNPQQITASSSLVTISLELSKDLPLVHNSIRPILDCPPPSLRIFEFPNQPPHPGLSEKTRLNDVEFRVREVPGTIKLELGITAFLHRSMLKMDADKHNFRVVEFTETVDVFDKLFRPNFYHLAYADCRMAPV